jgi:hypothetical protein
LTAEGTGDEAGAERALASLFAALPAEEPPPHLVHRVLCDTVWAVAPAPRVVARRIGRRIGLAGALAAAVLAAAAGFTVSVLSPVVWRFTPGAALGGSVDVTLGFFRQVGRWLGPAVEVLLGLLRAAGDLAAAANTTPVVALLAVALLAAAGSLKVLHDVVERDRREYVEFT